MRNASTGKHVVAASFKLFNMKLLKRPNLTKFSEIEKHGQANLQLSFDMFVLCNTKEKTPEAL